MIQRRLLNKVYPAVSRRIVPILEERYRPLAYGVHVMGRLSDLSCIHKLDYRKSRLLTNGKKPTFYSHIIDNYA